MLRASRTHLAEGALDLAAFLAEQSAQLYLKSVVLELVGEVPRTHLIRELLSILRRVKYEKEIDEFIKTHRAVLTRLESAYLESRYLPKYYEKDEVRELVEAAEEVVSFAGRFSSGA